MLMCSGTHLDRNKLTPGRQTLYDLQTFKNGQEEETGEACYAFATYYKILTTPLNGAALRNISLELFSSKSYQ